MADVISELVSPQGQKQVDDLVVSLRMASEEIIKINSTGLRLVDDVKAAKTLQELEIKALRAEQALQKLNEQKAKTAIADEKLAAIREKAARAAEEEEKKTKELNSAYKILSDQYRAAARAAQDIGASIGTTNEKFKAAAKEALGLANRLKEIDAAVGKHQRSVGDYGKAWNGLQVSINNITRELPNAALGMNQFFLAISNNIPTVIDEIDKARAANEKLAAQGEATIPVWKRLSGALISWQTALSIGIALLTAYGKEVADFAAELFTASKPIDENAIALDNYNKSIKKTAESTAEQVVELKALEQRFFDSAASAKDKSEVMQELNKKYKDNIGELKNVNEVEKFFRDKSGLFIEALNLRAEAMANLSLATDAYKERAKLAADPTEVLSGFAKAGYGIKAFGTAIYRNNLSWTDFMADIQSDYAWNKLTGSVGRANKEMQKQDTIIKNTTDTYTKLMERAGKIEEQGGFDFTVNEEKKTKKKKEHVEKRSRFEQKSMEQELYDNVTAIEKIAGKQKDIDAQKLKDEVDINTASLKNQTAFAKAQEKIDEDARKKKEEKDKDARQKGIAAAIKLEEELQNTVFAFIDARFERELQDVERRQNLIEEVLQSQLRAIELSGATEQEQTHLVAEAEAEAAVQRKQLAREEAAIKRRQAISDRAAAIAQVIQQTAIAIASAGKLLFAGIPLVAWYAAIGAAQIAQIVAQPLPQFRHGTKSSPEGPAIVGEAGTEMTIDPSGNVGFTPDKATIQYLKRGTQVIPADQTRKIVQAMATDGIIAGAMGDRWDDKGIIAAIHKAGVETVKAINRKQFKAGSDFNFELYARLRTGKMN